jgi:hypothetical protein
VLSITEILGKCKKYVDTYPSCNISRGYNLSTQNQDKMKNQLSNIALEGTCSGDVVGGLLSWTVESLQALLFLEKGGKP